MLSVLWIIFATVVGAAIGEYGFDHQALIGAAAGFVIGGILRVAVAGGAAGGLADIVDIGFDAFD